MSMRKFRVFVMLVAAVLCAAGTANGQDPAKFTLKGNIDYVLEGYEKGAVIESIALRQYPRMKIVGNGGGNLSYYGVFDGKPQVAELVVDLTVPGGSGSTNLAFVLEEGIIEFDGGAVPKGGKLNNALRGLLEELPKMKEKDAVETIRNFVAQVENAPASVILLSGAKHFVGADNAFNLVVQSPKEVRGHWAIKSILPQLRAEAFMEQNRKATDSGQKFKDFSVYYKGKMLNLSDYVGKGKYVLVDFWASWCGPCMQEIPNLINVYKKYAGEKFDVLGVAVNDKPQNTEQAIEKLGIPYPQIIGAGNEISAIYGINAIPHIILFAPDGTVLHRGLRGAQIEEAIKKVLK